MVSCAAGGATEHASGQVSEGVLAFSDIRLAGSAMVDKKWPKHTMNVAILASSLFQQATGRGRALVGVLLNDVGA